MTKENAKKTETKDKVKYFESETKTIMRSQINFAPYNPKKHSDEAISEQGKNIKRVGLLGGIVWNQRTGNLVSGHKRIMAADKLNKYDGSILTDYPVKVEVVNFDLKTEKEQNIYMDAKGTNTPQDWDLLAELLPDIDFKLAGITDLDMQFLNFGEKPEKQKKADQVDKTDPEYKQKMIEHKKEIRENLDKKFDEGDPIVTLSFNSFKSKCSFMERFGFDIYDKFIKGETFSEMIERID